LQGFKTCADTVKANEEGEVVLYSTSPEAAAQKMLALFRAQFPQIKTNYVRLQAGALYAKVLAERQAKSYLSTRCRYPTWEWCSISRKRAAMSITSHPRWRATRKRRKASPRVIGPGDRSVRPASPITRTSFRPPIRQDLEGTARPEMDRRGQRQGIEFRAAARVVV